MALGTTGALIASAAIQAGTSAAGFAQAGKARKEMKKAEAEADKAMAAARKKLEVNYLAGLSIAKEPYELARENLLEARQQLYRRVLKGRLEVQRQLRVRYLWLSKRKLGSKELQCHRK